jgi:hypothetical protein
MVAMVIGLLVLNGLFQIFMSNKQSYRAQDAQSRLQENARMASVFLGENFAKAGFHQNADEDPASIFNGSNPTLIGTNNNTDATDLILNGTDTITIRFQGDGNLKDCRGITVAAGVLSRNEFRVSTHNALECDNNDGSGFQTFLNDVQNIQIMYGEDTDLDGSVDQYRHAGTVTNFNDVRSVHFALLLASDADVKPAAESKSYSLLDTTMTMPPAGSDRIQRRVIERVVALRNRLL